MLVSDGAVVVELVAEEDDQVVGHILFSRLFVTEGHERFPAVALAPLAVEPSFHGTGIGGALVREAHVRLVEAGEKLSVSWATPLTMAASAIRISAQRNSTATTKARLCRPSPGAMRPRLGGWSMLRPSAQRLMRKRQGRL